MRKGRLVVLCAFLIGICALGLLASETLIPVIVAAETAIGAAIYREIELYNMKNHKNENNGE